MSEEVSDEVLKIEQNQVVHFTKISTQAIEAIKNAIEDYSIEGKQKCIKGRLC